MKSIPEGGPCSSHAAERHGVAVESRLGASSTHSCAAFASEVTLAAVRASSRDMHQDWSFPKRKCLANAGRASKRPRSVAFDHMYLSFQYLANGAHCTMDVETRARPGEISSEAAFAGAALSSEYQPASPCLPGPSTGGRVPPRRGSARRQSPAMDRSLSIVRRSGGGETIDKHDRCRYPCSASRIAVCWP